MSSSTAPVSPELTTEWAKATSDVKPYRYLQIKIQKETLNLVAKSAGTVSTSKDYDELQSLVGDGEACYFLFRIAGPKNWILISYVPEGRVKVADKMIYAATKNTLKTKLGFQFINEEQHFTSPSDLSYSHYTRSKEPASALSEFEKTRQKVHQAEEEERMSISNSPKIGGYHQVTIPFTEEAKAEIERVKNGSVNFIEFRINKPSEVVEHVESKTLAPSELASNVRGSEPRYYLYAKAMSTNVFIYYCPDKSPPPLRMVYATSKPALAQQITQLGIQISKKLEICEGSALNDELSDSSPSYSSPYSPHSPSARHMHSPPASSSRSPPVASVLSSQSAPTHGSRPVPGGVKPGIAPHPIYSLMGPGKSAGPSKKVVMPPPGAYC